MPTVSAWSRATENAISSSVANSSRSWRVSDPASVSARTRATSNDFVGAESGSNSADASIR